MKFFLIFPLSVALLMVLAVLCGYRLNTTPSLPQGVWRQGGGIERGGFALFCLEDAEFIKLAKERGYLSEGQCPGGIKPLGKEIVGLAGDKISFSGGSGGQIAVNGKLLADSSVKNEDGHRRHMPATLLTEGRIPPGQALMMSPHNAGGFDSRYFGLIKISALTPVQPVFTWE